MAARRTLYDNTIDYGQPIPESPARKQADINLPEYIGAWVRDQKPSIAKNSTDITNKLIEMGFESKDDLKRMRDHTVLMAALGINYVQAMALADDAMAIHNQPTASFAAAPLAVDRTIPLVPPVRKLVPYEAWTGKMEVPPGSHVCSEAELHRWMAALLCFVEAQSPSLGPILREFCINPGMQDPEYNNLHAKIPEFDDRQLAHAISGSIPSSMQERITTTLGIAALGLDILRQVTAVHYGSSAIKFKIKAAADLCYNKVIPVTSRCDLQVALEKHLKAINILKDNGQTLGEDMQKIGLNALVSKLQMADEITAATNIIESTGDWTCAHLIAIIRKRAEQWLFLPGELPYKEAACAGVFRHSTQCHQHLAGNCKKKRGHGIGECPWLHDPDFKGRKDLVPVCNRMDAQGNCQLPQGTCIFRHPIPSVPPKVADIPPAPQQVQHVAVVAAATGAPIADTVSELAEIKTLLLGLLQEQVSQKALISAIFAETTDE